ncbi:MAG TPA: Gfo/Idh/MocA family oxidoreductase [Longimicrobiales bacterium]|nr:Gfo/Idh/MocA family oxidoreductase [Longimicrobiales bacterium]
MAVAPVGVAVIGCGLIGTRRAHAAATHPATALRVVVDTDTARAATVAATHGAAVAGTWQEAVSRPDVGAVAVCTPNALLVPIAVEALRMGRHVLIEKPMGRNVAEAQRLADAASGRPAVLKIGFNHRFHRALARAHALFSAGAIGELLQLRARYGHGSRPGCEREWRADAQLAGGGELLDQGVHIIDLCHWFGGAVERVQAELQTAAWRIEPLEDNAFALLRFASGAVAQLHVSMTQWHNLFSFEVHGSTGALVVEGLGGSYGAETLTMVRRNLAGGVPAVETMRFENADPSWTLEWDDFVAAMAGAPLRGGSVADGLAAMQVVESIYRAAAAAPAAATPVRTVVELS